MRTNLVDTGLADQALDMVTVAKCGRERLQDNSAHTFTTSVAINVLVPHS